MDDKSEARLAKAERAEQRRYTPAALSRAELVTLARQVHVPGNADVDELLRLLADELEAVTQRQSVPTPAEVTVADLRTCHHPDGHPMTTRERAWYASYTAAHEVGAGHVDSARFATRQVDPEALL